MTLAPPALIIQDELHLISGPLGTVAALYEVALDRLATREWEGKRVRPKVVASTATVRRAGALEALFDRHRTEIFPPPGPLGETHTVLYRPCRFRKGPEAHLSAGPDHASRGSREGGARRRRGRSLSHGALLLQRAPRIGRCAPHRRDEVRARLASYGTERRRIAPPDQPFANRRLRDVLELTSRENTDKVAAAKEALARMVVQGQPKAAAEYIQAASRVGRRADKPGLMRMTSRFLRQSALVMGALTLMISTPGQAQTEAESVGDIMIIPPNLPHEFRFTQDTIDIF